eukprot:CAMPEP_0119154946 /NCGR_PEP_ID=MMETSP1310-20130426/51484_1 /TAXON_ID=464262 /ORGANISM="Genus nov. species nov., Strain RCC2339" /LENGTH=318 /DNA_ID=CAMNT_0007147525 /DNA_START=1 /DNA_END=954 /DNA_ORIENTATION=+
MGGDADDLDVALFKAFRIRHLRAQVRGERQYVTAFSYATDCLSRDFNLNEVYFDIFKNMIVDRHGVQPQENGTYVVEFSNRYGLRDDLGGRLRVWKMAKKPKSFSVVSSTALKALSLLHAELGKFELILRAVEARPQLLTDTALLEKVERILGTLADRPELLSSSPNLQDNYSTLHTAVPDNLENSASAYDHLPHDASRRAMSLTFWFDKLRRKLFKPETPVLETVKELYEKCFRSCRSQVEEATGRTLYADNHAFWIRVKNLCSCLVPDGDPNSPPHARARYLSLKMGLVRGDDVQTLRTLDLIGELARVDFPACTC